MSGSRILEDCLHHTKRTYPAGYGFALGYCTDAVGMAEVEAMKHCAWYVLQERAELGDADAVRFVEAVGAAVGDGNWRWWLVEAVQLVLSAAIAGNYLAAMTLRAWHHPGY